MQKAIRFLLLAGGLGLAAYIVHANAGAIREALGRVGWGFALYVLASSLIYLCDGAAWHFTFVKGQPPVGFLKLFSIRMAGEALNKVTPLASMGGEPLKALLLTRTGSNLRDAAASVAISKNCITLAQIGFIFVAVAMALPLFPAKTGLILSFAIFPGIIFAAMIVTAILDVSLRRRQKLLLEQKEEAPVSDPNAKKTLKQEMIDMWAQCADFYWENPRASAIAFVLFFLGWAGGAVETWVGARLLGLELSAYQAVVVEGLLVGINMATFFVPANAGAQEGGRAFLAPLMGLTTPGGVALAVLRRCRDVVWIGYGLLYLFATEGRILVQADPKTADAAA
jgi:uncharacterized protein (TIRG00374 family)